MAQQADEKRKRDAQKAKEAAIAAAEEKKRIAKAEAKL